MDKYAAARSGHDQLPQNRAVASVSAWGRQHHPPALQQHLPLHHSQAQLNSAQWQPYLSQQAGPQWQHKQPSSGWHDHPQTLPAARGHRRAPDGSWQQQQVNVGWHGDLQERSEVQLNTEAPDTSCRQQLPSLGWHDSPMGQSRAGACRGASGTSWQEHQRRAGAAAGAGAGASGHRLHHMRPSMLYKSVQATTLWPSLWPCCAAATRSSLVNHYALKLLHVQPRKQPLSCTSTMCRAGFGFPT